MPFITRRRSNRRKSGAVVAAVGAGRVDGRPQLTSCSLLPPGRVVVGPKRAAVTPCSLRHAEGVFPGAILPRLPKSSLSRSPCP